MTTGDFQMLYIRFNITAVEKQIGGAYGTACYKTVFKNTPVNLLNGCRVYMGDSAKTLAGKENVCVIGLAAPQQKLEAIKQALSSNSEFMAVSAINSLEFAPIGAEPLVLDGTFTTDGDQLKYWAKWSFDFLKKENGFMQSGSSTSVPQVEPGQAEKPSQAEIIQQKSQQFQSIEVIPKQRHGCLWAWLIMAIIAHAGIALMFGFGDDVLNGIEDSARIWSVIAAVINLVCIILIFNWKRIGFWGLCATTVLAFIINLNAGMPLQAIAGLSGIAILYGVLMMQQGGISGWQNMEGLLHGKGVSAGFRPEKIAAWGLIITSVWDTGNILYHAGFQLPFTAYLPSAGYLVFGILLLAGKPETYRKTAYPVLLVTATGILLSKILSEYNVLIPDISSIVLFVFAALIVLTGKKWVTFTAAILLLIAGGFELVHLIKFFVYSYENSYLMMSLLFSLTFIASNIFLAIYFILPARKKVIEYENRQPADTAATGLVSGNTSPTVPGDSAIIHFYRRGSMKGCLISFDVYLGDVAVFRATNKSRASVPVKTEGVYSLRAKTESSTEIPVDIRFGREYFVRCSLGFGAFVGRPKIELVDENTGRAEFYHL